MGFATNLPPATVSFLDGSYLRGEIESLNSEVLRWRHPNARQPIEFSTTNLNVVQLATPPPRPLTNTGPACRLRFSSGDEMDGHLITLDEASFEVETWFAGRLRGRRAGLSSLTFWGTNQATLYEGPQAADEWKVSSSSGLVNRGVEGGNVLFNGGRVVFPPAQPLLRIVEPEPLRGVAPAGPKPNINELVAKLKDQLNQLGERATPVVKETVERALKSVEVLAAKEEAKPAAQAVPTPQELIRQLKAELASLGENVSPVVKQALEKRLKEVEAEAAKAAPTEPDKNPTKPEEKPARTTSAKTPAERRTKELVNSLVTRLERAGEKQLVEHIVGWELAMQDGQRTAARPQPASPVKPSPLEVAPGNLPMPIPGGPARKTFTEAEVTKLTEAAEKATTVAEFLKSDLITTALAEKQTSRAAQDRWFAEFEKPVDWQNDAVKTARFQAMLRAETDLLGRRLLGRAAPFGEQPAPEAAPVAAHEPPRNAPGLVPVLQMMTDAMKAETAEAFLKSDLVKAAVEGGVASLKAEERWIGDFAKPAELEADKEKQAAFKERVRAEATLLAGRLVPALAPPVRLDQPLLANNLQMMLGGDGAPPRAATGPAWTFRDGAFYSTGTGTLGRECNLPTKARVEFDMGWRGQPYFRFSFFTRSPDQFDYSDGWQFYVSGSGYVYPMRRGGAGAVNISSSRIPQMQTKNSVRLSFLLDTEKESAILLADGEKITEWKTLGRPGNGTGLVFYNYNSNSRIRISNLSITPWNGIHGEPEREPDQKEAEVRFANQDRATGTLYAIREGKLVLGVAERRLEIPVSRVASITFPIENTPPLAENTGVQLSLHRSERLTLVLEKWEAGRISAVSPVFGRLQLSSDSVRKLRFNPAMPRTGPDELNWPGDALSTRP
ncbi:MAG: hypothetical protein EBS05_01845 [Proteobacteria bacterium]|nr:hypothetical protein [Pseudomonadota bacterium]